MSCWIELLLLLQSVLLCATVDWCKLRCGDGELHTMCGYGDGPSRRPCRNMRHTMTPSKRADLLHWHNSYRNFIAAGELSVDGVDITGVANMRQMTYYDDLETVAKKWAEQCIPDHDVCRTTPRFEDYVGFNSGQNFGTQKSDRRLPSSGTTRYNFLEWANERKNVPSAVLESFESTGETQGEIYSHWTQLVWANTFTLGCAEVVYEIGVQFERTTICNYGPGGNIEGQKVFKLGPACSSCPHGTSCRANSDYPSLCALPDDPRTRGNYINFAQRTASNDEPEMLSDREKEMNEDRAALQYQGNRRGNAWRRPPLVQPSVKMHKEPGTHEPEPEEHDEPGKHELGSLKHREPGRHEPVSPRVHAEPGVHEPVILQHNEPGQHEPKPEKHMEPGEHEEMHRIHYEPGQHEVLPPGGGSARHKEPGWHEPRPANHEEPGVHEPVPAVHIEPGNHEQASPKKHREPGFHEPKNPRIHMEPGRHEPELEKHKEPGKHEPEFEKHNEPGKHEEAHSSIYYGARDVAPAPADPAAAQPAPAPADAAPAAPPPPPADAAPAQPAPAPADVAPAPAAPNPADAAPAQPAPAPADVAPAPAAPAPAPAEAAPNPADQAPAEAAPNPVDVAPAQAAQDPAGMAPAQAALNPAAADSSQAPAAPAYGDASEIGLEAVAPENEPVPESEGEIPNDSGLKQRALGSGNGSGDSNSTGRSLKQFMRAANGLEAFSAVIICVIYGWFGGMIYLIEKFV